MKKVPSTLNELEASPVERKISRASFLRLLGTGIGLSLVPGSLGAPRGGTSAAQTLDPATPNMLTGDQYPIGIWWPPPPEFTTIERYAEIAQAGFNFVIGGNRVVNDDTNPAALDAAAANGLRFLLTDNRLKRLIEESAGAGSAGAQEARDPEPASIMRYLLDQADPEAATSRGSDFSARATSIEVRQRIEWLLSERYKSGDYPALSGLNLYDEPPRRLFATLADARSAMQEIAPGTLPYVVALPSYATRSALGTATYEGYLERYMSEVRPPVLSFGHYPLLRRGITLDYFFNWAQIRRFSLRFEVPSWAFIQSVGFDSRVSGFKDRRRPSEAEIRWQVNVSLAYGAKGIQYFTYWTPADTPQIEFGQALVSEGGDRTPLYDYAKNANAYLKVVGRELLPLISEAVVHAGEKRLPLGARPFRADNYVRAVGGDPVILARFRKPGLSGARYLLVANRSPAKVARGRLTLSKRIRQVFRLDIGTENYVRVALRGTPRRELGVRLAPGSGRLYLLRTG